MSKSILVLCVLSATVLVACSGYQSFPINHTLTPTPPAPKPTANCTAADAAVFQIMAADQSLGFENTTATVLNDDVSCAVQVQLSPTMTTAQITQLVSDYKAKASSSAFMILNKAEIPLWYTMVLTTPKSAVPTTEDCVFAQNLAVETFTKAKISVVTDPRNPNLPTRCYVQATFANETDFQAFLEFTYPAGSGQKDPFHVLHTQDDNSVHAVDIYATVTPVAIQN